jgi:hypothetical protein
MLSWVGILFRGTIDVAEVVSTSPDRAERFASALLRKGGLRMFEIVKREYTRFVRLLVLQPASAPAGSLSGYVRQAMSLGESLKTGLSLMACRAFAGAGADHKSNQVS